MSALPRLTLHCAAHSCSTVQGKCFDPVCQDISGCIAFSLVQRMNVAPSTFRECLAKVLEASVQVKVGVEPPSAAAPKAVLRDSLLKFTLAETQAGRARMEKLQLLLHGDIRCTEIDYCVHDGVVFDKKKWARALAALLYPAAIQPFPRHHLSVPSQAPTRTPGDHGGSSQQPCFEIMIECL